MKQKYCYECPQSKQAGMHFWIKTNEGCKCKYCGMEADNKEDANEIFGITESKIDVRVDSNNDVVGELVTTFKNVYTFCCWCDKPIATLKEVHWWESNEFCCQECADKWYESL